MGASCARQEVVDSRYLEVRCPFPTIKSETVVVPLPLQLNAPPPLRSQTTALNTFVQEYNAKLRVGHQLLTDLTQALSSVTFTYYSDASYVKDFSYKSLNRGTNDLQELGSKIDAFRYLQILSEKIAEFLVIDCSDQVILKSQHQSDLTTTTNHIFSRSIKSSINQSFSELSFSLDFDFWGCKELVKLIIKMLAVAVDFSIVKHRYGNAFNQDICFFKEKIAKRETEQTQDSKQLIQSEIMLQQGSVQNKVVQSLQNFFASSDPILNFIAVKFKSLQGEDDQEWGLPKTEKISSFFEGLAWLTKHTVEKYRGKYNQEISEIIKAGVAAESVLIRAESLRERWPKFEEVDEKEKTKAAILENWWAFLQNSFQDDQLVLLPVNKMATPSKDFEIYAKGAVMKDAERMPVGSPFLDLSEEMLGSIPTYADAEVVDPYRFDERLTVKFKHIPKRPGTIKKLKKQITQEFRPSYLLNDESNMSSDQAEQNWELLKFPEEMGRREFKSLLAFLAQRLDVSYLT